MTDSTSEFAIDDEIRAAVVSAYDEGKTLTLAYVDADGWAQPSKHGSTVLLDAQTLAVWGRNPRDGLATSITH